MSNSKLKKILTQAILDEDFRHRLFSNLPQINEEFQLTEIEIQALKSIEETTFRVLCDELSISIIREKKKSEVLPLLMV